MNWRSWRGWGGTIPAGFAVVSRTQALVLGFFAFVLGALVVLLVAAPETYAQALELPAEQKLAALAFLIGLTAFLALLTVGVIRRWRWTFWLILVAFLAGVLRVPASALQLAGVLPASAPAWYVVFQGILGLVQLAIGLLMLAGYRRAGRWG
jgi:hypothetical protein